MKPWLLAVVLAVSSGAAHAQSDAESYRAVGATPAWTLTIGPTEMRFEAPGGTRLGAPLPRPIVGFNGERYVTPQLTVDIVHTPCSQDMSDRRYRDSVTVAIGRVTYRGCGGGPSQASAQSLLDGSWRVHAINGRMPPAGAPATVSFRGVQISGNTGCNSFGGSFRYERGFLTTGPLISTQRACLRFDHAQERDLLDILGERLKVTRLGEGRLLLSGDRDRLVLVPSRA